METIDISPIIQKGGITERAFFMHLNQQGIYWMQPGSNLNLIALYEPTDLGKIQMHYPEVKPI
jgi:hypothetical protein